MFDRARMALTIAGCLLATPVAAQAPATTTAFDGTYYGVSRTFEESSARQSTRHEPGHAFVFLTARRNR